MKVLHLIDYYPFYAGRVVYEIKKRLSSNGVVVKVFASDLMTHSGHYKDDLMVRRLRARALFVGNSPYLLYDFRDLGLPLKELDADIIHVHFLYSLLSLYTGAMKRLNKIKAPIIATSHGLTTGYSSRVVRMSAKLLRELSKRLLVKCCSAVTTVSKVEYAYLSSFVPEEKLFYLPNGVDTSFFTPSDSKRRIMRERFGFDKKDIVFLFFAYLRAAKGVPTFLEAAQQVIEKTNQIKFMIAGSGPLENYVKEKVRESGGKIRALLGYLSDEDMPYLYNASDVYVLPSYVEGMPLALMEAMACGKPVIATSVGDVPLLVKQGTNGFVIHPGDTSSLADSIIRLAEDSNLRKRMAETNVRETAKYDWGEVARKYYALYSETLGRY